MDFVFPLTGEVHESFLSGFDVYQRWGKIREIKLNKRHVEDKWLSSVWKQKGRGWKNQTVMYESASHPIIFGDNSQSTGIHRRLRRPFFDIDFWPA